MKSSQLRELESELRTVADPAEVAGLLHMAESISAIPQPVRDSSARQVTRGRITGGAQPTVRVQWWFRGWAMALVPIAAAAVVVVVAASQSVAPNHALYGVKRLSEQARLAVAFTPAAKAEHCSMNMRQRAEELAALGPSSAVTVQSLATDIATEAHEFGEFAAASGTQAARLNALRATDAAYVVTKLEAAQRTHSAPEDQAAIQRLLETMRKLANPTV